MHGSCTAKGVVSAATDSGGFVDGSGAGRFGHRNPRSPGVQTEHRQVLTPPVHRIACQLATALVAWVDHELGPARALAAAK